MAAASAARRTMSGCVWRALVRRLLQRLRAAEPHGERAGTEDGDVEGVEMRKRQRGRARRDDPRCGAAPHRAGGGWVGGLVELQGAIDLRYAAVAEDALDAIATEPLASVEHGYARSRLPSVAVAERLAILQ